MASTIFTSRSKSDYLSNLIRKRISTGEYRSGFFPSERVLATELGVSRGTMRKVLDELLASEQLERQDNGRLAVRTQVVEQHAKFKVLLAMPAWPGREFEFWSTAMMRVSREVGFSVRLVQYVDWEDPALFRDMDHVDGIVIMPVTSDMPKMVIERLRQCACSVAVLEFDQTANWLPCVFSYPTTAMAKVLEHLHDLGHQQIDCLNCQPHDAVIRSRIDVWKIYLKSNGLDGQLFNEPVQSYESVMPWSYQQVKALIQSNKIKGTALYCTTTPAAVGACRACYDMGIEVSKDLSIAVVNDEGLGPFIRPSLTSLAQPDYVGLIRECMKWVLDEQEGWRGPMLIQPKELKLVIGESTGPANQ